MAKRRRSNGDGAVCQTKDGRGRATVDLGWAKGTRQRKYLSGPTEAAVSRSAREALAQGAAWGGVTVVDDAGLGRRLRWAACRH